MKLVDDTHINDNKNKEIHDQEQSLSARRTFSKLSSINSFNPT
jgi:hypothetical protein